MQGTSKTGSFSKTVGSNNVTDYKHILVNPHSSFQMIEWTMNLRNHQESQQNSKGEGGVPPSCFYKSTLSQDIKKQKQKDNSASLAYSQYKELGHNQGVRSGENYYTHPFISSLRQGQGSKKKQKKQAMLKNEQIFKPKMLKKESIKKVKNLEAEDFEQTQGCMNDYGQYTQKIVKNKNTGLTSTFIKASGRAKINLPGLAWQVGLRS